MAQSTTDAVGVNTDYIPDPFSSRSRPDMHALVVAAPLVHVEQAFGITQLSSPDEMLAIFTQCAHDTGMSKSAARDAVEAFRSRGHVPEFVKQCCSAVLAKE